MEWLQAHWTEVAGVAAFVVIIGERVAAWTENQDGRPDLCGDPQSSRGAQGQVPRNEIG
jgi:hypothetical protein